MRFFTIGFKITRRLLADWSLFLSGEPVLVDTKAGIIRIERLDAVKDVQEIKDSIDEMRDDLGIIKDNVT